MFFELYNTPQVWQSELKLLQSGECVWIGWTCQARSSVPSDQCRCLGNQEKKTTKQFTGNSKCYTGKRSSAHNPLETPPLICQCINMHLVCLSFYALKIALYLIYFYMHYTKWMTFRIFMISPVMTWTIDVTWTILVKSLWPFWTLNVSVVLLSMEGQKALKFHHQIS